MRAADWRVHGDLTAERRSHMDSRDKASIVEKQIERLHAEVMERLKNYSALWRTVILGIAGIIALGDKRDLDLIVLLAPPLAVLVLAYWLNEQGSLAAVAREIAMEEDKLNGIVKESLLAYESRRHRLRSSSLLNQGWVFTGCIIIGTIAYSAAMYAVSRSQQLADKFVERDDLKVAYWVLVIGAYLVACLNAIRCWMLTRGPRASATNDPAVPPTPAV